MLAKMWSKRKTSPLLLECQLEQLLRKSIRWFLTKLVINIPRPSYSLGHIHKGRSIQPQDTWTLHPATGHVLNCVHRSFILTARSGKNLTVPQQETDEVNETHLPNGVSLSCLESLVLNNGSTFLNFEELIE